MKFIDCILRPKTIKTGIYVRDGLAYFVLGNYISVIKPRHKADLLAMPPGTRWV